MENLNSVENPFSLKLVHIFVYLQNWEIVFEQNWEIVFEQNSCFWPAIIPCCFARKLSVTILNSMPRSHSVLDRWQRVPLIALNLCNIIHKKSFGVNVEKG